MLDLAFLSMVSPATVVAMCIAVVTMVLWIAKTSKVPSNLPPGPPENSRFLANMHFLKKRGQERIESLIEMTQKHGSAGVATVKIATRNHIVLTDYETIKRVLNDDAFTGRPKLYVIDKFYKRKGLLFTDGPLWQEHRRFALTTLRDFGMGKTWLQDLIIEEVKELVDELQALRSKPVNPVSYLTPSVSNIICAVAFGQRFGHNDHKFRRLTTLMGQSLQMNARNYHAQFFPFLRFIPFSGYRSRYLAIWKNNMELKDFLLLLVDEHQSTFQQGEARDYIDAFMVEAEKQRSNPDTTFTKEQLEMSIANLFGAGTETTSTTLAWAIVHLLENPDCYEKVQEEVDMVVPDGSFPNLDQKDSLPYLQATIMEVQRMSNLVPVVARTTMEEVKLNGFTIPAGMWILPILNAVHKDPRYFPNPEKFDPARFLNENGQLNQKVEGFLPFSVGKRFCPGESLAKMELYLFLAGLIKHFSFRVPPGTTVSSQNGVMSLVHSPQPYEVIFSPRTGQAL